MEVAPSVKPRGGSPPIPPNYVSLRQLQELRLKEEEEQGKRQREEAARKAEMEAVAAAGVKRDAKVSAVVSATPVRAKQTSDRGPGPRWVAVAHRPAVQPPPRGEDVLGTIGVGRDIKGLADAPRAGGKPEGKANGDGTGKVSAITSTQTPTYEPGKRTEASSHGGKLKIKDEGKVKWKAKASGGTSAEPGSIGGSGESAGASSRRRKNPKGKKGAGGRRAEPSPDGAPAKTTGAPPPQGVKPESAGKPKSPGPKRAGASPISDSSRGKMAEARPPPPTSAAAGSVVGEIRTTAEIKPEGFVEGHHRPPLLEDHGVAEQKQRVVKQRRSSRRPPSDRCNGAGEKYGRVWVPKAAAGRADL